MTNSPKAFLCSLNAEPSILYNNIILYYINFNFAVKEIFCKSCYGREYGPKGYGYGAGAGSLNMVGSGGKGYVEHTGPLTAAGTTYMGGNRCKRCGGSVYHAEEVIAAGLVRDYSLQLFF